MKRFHIAIAISDLTQSITDYSKRLGCAPDIVIPNEYALWKTEILNFSIRKTNETTGLVRHIGFEDSTAKIFTKDKDCNGLTWENFNEQNQVDEIRAAWPDLF